MQPKTAKIMIGVVIILIAAIGGLAFLRTLDSNKFVWQYKVTTDSRWTTMENDGGSNTNVYYLINFTDRQIQKCEDKFFGPMHKYDYRDKIIYQKTLSDKIATKLQEVLDKAWKDGDKTEGTYDFYAIEHPNGESRYVYSKSQISQIKLYIDKIDSQTSE